MFKISGAKLFSYDFRDYSLMSFMDKKDALRHKSFKLSDDFRGVKLSDDFVNSKEYKAYLADDDIRHLIIDDNTDSLFSKDIGDKKKMGVSITIGELYSKEKVEMKKLGKVPVEFKKGLITKMDSAENKSFSSGKTVYYVSSTKIGSKQIHHDEELDPKKTAGVVPLKAQLNFVVNKSISDKDFATEKWKKLADKAEAKIKTVSARTKTMFKVGDKASSKILFVKKEGISGFSTYAAILVVDPIKGSRELLTFGDREADVPTTNVKDHTHILVESDKGLVGFVANLFKNMSFFAGKIVPKGTTGPDKAGIVAKELCKFIKGLIANKEFVGVAASA